MPRPTRPQPRRHQDPRKHARFENLLLVEKQHRLTQSVPRPDVILTSRPRLCPSKPKHRTSVATRDRAGPVSRLYSSQVVWQMVKDADEVLSTGGSYAMGTRDRLLRQRPSIEPVRQEP